MTAGADVARHGGGFHPSVRGSRLPRPGRIGWALLGVVVAAIAVDGIRGLLPAFPRGDLLYHWGLTHAILRGELPPGGPYQGLPAYYPPGFHLLLAAVSTVAGMGVDTATLLIGSAWLPVLPLATFVLTRALTGRSDVSLLATILTVFGGAFELSSDRLWVNSLFLVGQAAYPLFPRDLVFGLLPLAVLSFVRSLEPGRTWAWALGAGLILGACALIQVQLLLPIPIALVVVAAAVAMRDRRRAPRAAIALLITGGLASLAIAPWLFDVLGLIRRNGGVALDSAETLLPLRLSFWDLPREFGFLLPLAALGIGLVLVHLRERDPVSTGLRPALAEAPLVLIPWFLVPWLLAVLYDPSWPVEDALRPQRLWLIASQPGAILAAIGVIPLAGWLRPRLGHPRLVRAVLAALVLVIAVPTVLLTLRLLFQTWTVPVYADLQLVDDRVPDMARVLGDTGPRDTVLTYEDWSSLVWYRTGSWVVAVNPPGYAKLAFDPAVFTGHGQDDRRADVRRAFDGDPADLAAVAEIYRADRILLARRGDRWGLVDQVASVVAAEPGDVTGSTSVIKGNGWDTVQLAAGARLLVPLQVVGRPIDLEIRFAGPANGRPAPDRRVRLLAVGPSGWRPLTDLAVPASPLLDWEVIPVQVTLGDGERLAIEAVDPVAVQSIRGFVDPMPPAGWQPTTATADAVVLARTR